MRNSTSHVPSVPLGVMELLLMCELSRPGPLGDSLLPLTRLWGLARSCISIDLTTHTQRDTQGKNQIRLWFHGAGREAELWHTQATHAHAHAQKKQCTQQVVPVGEKSKTVIWKHLSKHKRRECTEEKKNHASANQCVQVWAGEHTQTHTPAERGTFDVNKRQFNLWCFIASRPQTNNVFTVNFIRRILQLKIAPECIYRLCAAWGEEAGRPSADGCWFGADAERAPLKCTRSTRADYKSPRLSDWQMRSSRGLCLLWQAP